MSTTDRTYAPTYSPAPPRGRRPSTVALVLVTGTGALSTDTYIAALPALAASLATSDAAAQLTMTACIAGMAIGQLVIGPISDAHGRRRLVLASTVAFTVLSVVCALADSATVMIAARLLQGFACGAGVAVGRAVVNDTYVGRRAAAMFGTLTAVSLIAPVVGPAIGGVLLAVGDWRLVFWFLAAIGVAMTVAALVGLPETLPPSERHPGGLRALRLRSADLLRDRAFRTPVIVQSLTSAGFFIYIGGSSLVLQEDLGLTPGDYARLFTVNAVAMVAASIAYRLLVMRLGPVVLRRVAVVVQTTAVLTLVAVSTTSLPGRPPLVVVWVCLAAMTAGLGAFLPSNSAIAQEAGRRYAGTAAALGGGLPFLAGALTTPLTGVVGVQTVPVMASGMAFFFAAAAVTAVAAARSSRRRVLHLEA
ncbi:multidrug effflux MFS transporter [Nocardioides marmoribigeumensis]|uniref:DHA1 family bicyclomycin/chloramphenicol resistance-like MFS transporter n=1 Tax=Nocardioides marmoribigeumensis TaxID=433649 RepID=A0ABU2C1T5_9ACTN|nr:multidrug effflux MFS transporter [Nocardioides marmoribigeumensis]MDR7364602.1 DHA1 family bicyclomycin/chloramphenicol resistance-like MFS transporter [Nocardioides marmoribigeumensis]